MVSGFVEDDGNAVQVHGGAMLARAGAVAARRAVEEGDLFVEDQACAVSHRGDFDGGEGQGVVPPAQVHVVGIDDAPVRDDVVIVRGEDGVLAGAEAAVQHFDAADAEVELPAQQGPALRAVEPAGLLLDVGPGAVDPFDGGGVEAFDGEAAVGDGGGIHGG